MFLNLIFFIYWLSVRKKEFLISLLALILSINNIHNTVQLPKSTPQANNNKETKTTQIKILTYNVQIFNLLGRNSFGPRQKELFQFINNESPDVVCFQEFYTNQDKQMSYKKVNSLLSEYPYRHTEWIQQGKESNYGIAIYSKYPIIEKMRLSFENTNNSTIFSDIVVGKDTIRLFNNHLQSIKFNHKNYQFISNQASYSQSQKLKEIQDISFRLRDAFIKRAEQANHLASEIKKSPYPVVVCGDFNDTPVSYTYRKIKSDLNDAFLEAGQGFGTTYEGKFPSYRIDYILYSDDIEATYYSTRKVDYSDHYPVLATLQIN